MLTRMTCGTQLPRDGILPDRRSGAVRRRRGYARYHRPKKKDRSFAAARTSPKEIEDVSCPTPTSRRRRSWPARQAAGRRRCALHRRQVARHPAGLPCASHMAAWALHAELAGCVLQVVTLPNTAAGKVRKDMLASRPRQLQSQIDRRMRALCHGPRASSDFVMEMDPRQLGTVTAGNGCFCPANYRPEGGWAREMHRMDE